MATEASEARDVVHSGKDFIHVLPDADNRISLTERAGTKPNNET